MDRKILKSGEFLVENITSNDIFIPEEFNEEQRMIAQTCQDFLNAEVYPNVDKVDKQDRELMKSMLKKSGELGLMGISVPEEYNGFGQSFVTQMLAAETIGAGYSFSVAFMAHCGIGTLPILYYGNEDQRQRYVTRLATGELLGAYEMNSDFILLRYYSGLSYATLVRPSTLKRWNFLAGIESILPYIVGRVFNNRANIFASYHFLINGENKYSGNSDFMFGIKFGSWYKKGITFYAEFYSGQKRFNEYFRERIQEFGTGFYIDFF